MINKPGKYNGRPTQGTFAEAKSTGNLQVGVQFEIEVANEKGELLKEYLWWVGHFTEATQLKTFETLAMLGVEGDVSTCFNTLKKDQDFQLVVEMQADEREGKDPTKLYPRIRWVNSIGGKFGGLEIEIVKTKANQLDFANQLRIAKLALNEPKPARPATAQAAPKFPEPNVPNNGMGDLPF